MAFKTWMADRYVPMPFWKWLLFSLWLAACAFTIAFVGTSLGEKEYNAAVKGGIIFTIILILWAVFLWWLFHRQRIIQPT